MAAYKGHIVDVDVHHRPKTETELGAYLSKPWQENMRGNRSQIAGLTPPGTAVGALIQHGAARGDAIEEEGVQPGYDFDLYKEQVLDRHPYHKVVLTHDVGEWPAHANHYLLRELCRAANDWTVDQWLPRDERLTTVVVAPTGEPEQAAVEIRRMGSHPRFVAVLIASNPLGRPIGDPIYHPIFAAAADLGLPIFVHPGNDRPNTLIGLVGGPPATGAEYASQLSQQAMHYISSLIVHGVFEKYPSLQVLVAEYGIAWLPALMWRLDQQYDLLRRESPWVKRWPSEYIHGHIKLSTQPIEESPTRGGTAELLATIDGIEDLLCFSTDYPHASMDRPDYVARLLPSAWHRKVFCDNACQLYGWQSPVDNGG